MRSIWENPQKGTGGGRGGQGLCSGTESPLTIERLAASGRSRSELNRRLGKAVVTAAKVRALLKKACAEAVASVVEFRSAQREFADDADFLSQKQRWLRDGENEEGRGFCHHRRGDLE